MNRVAERVRKSKEVPLASPATLLQQSLKKQQLVNEIAKQRPEQKFREALVRAVQEAFPSIGKKGCESSLDRVTEHLAGERRGPNYRSERCLQWQTSKEESERSDEE